MPTQVITDEVWSSLDVGAGRLSRRDRHRLLAAGAAGLVALVIATIGYVCGLFVPHISAMNDTAASLKTHHDIRAGITLTNDGYFAEHVTRLDIADPAFVLSAGAALSLTLHGHESANISVLVHVRDCAQAGPDRAGPDRRVRFSVTTQHWWGGLTRSILVAGVLRLSAADACH